MKLIFDRSFLKSLDKIKTKEVGKRIEKLITAIEKTENLSEITNVKKLEGFKTFYRIRIGDYRLGFELEDDKTIRFIIIAHRKDIYKGFP